MLMGWDQCSWLSVPRSCCLPGEECRVLGGFEGHQWSGRSENTGGLGSRCLPRGQKAGLQAAVIDTVQPGHRHRAGTQGRGVSPYPAFTVGHGSPRLHPESSWLPAH